MRTHAAARPVPMRRQSVLVVGLLGSQQHEISATYGETFDLRFLTQDDASTRMKENAAHVDVTYGMVGYMNHSVDKTLKKFAKDYRRVNGTVGDLKRSLMLLKAS